MRTLNTCAVSSDSCVLVSTTITLACWPLCFLQSKNKILVLFPILFFVLRKEIWRWFKGTGYRPGMVCVWHELGWVQKPHYAWPKWEPVLSPFSSPGGALGMGSLGMTTLCHLHCSWPEVGLGSAQLATPAKAASLATFLLSSREIKPRLHKYRSQHSRSCV